MTSGMSKVDYEQLAAFRYALRQFLRFSEEAAEAVGLKPQQHQALLAIRGFPGRDSVTIGELAERLQIRHHSTVGLVDRLVGLGFVTREQSSEDRRQVLVRLTPAGEEILERLSIAHRDELLRLRPELMTLLEQLVGRGH